MRSIDSYFHPPGAVSLGSHQAAASSRPVMGLGAPRASPEYSAYGDNRQHEQGEQLQFHGRGAGEGLTLGAPRPQTSHGRGHNRATQSAFHPSSLSAVEVDAALLVVEEDEGADFDAVQADFDRSFAPAPAATAHKQQQQRSKRRRRGREEGCGG